MVFPYFNLFFFSNLGRDLLYFTFGDEDLRDKIFDTYTLLIDHSITVGVLYQVSYFSQFDQRDFYTKLLRRS